MKRSTSMLETRPSVPVGATKYTLKSEVDRFMFHDLKFLFFFYFYFYCNFLLVARV
jgi:hypothetical protein